MHILEKKQTNCKTKEKQSKEEKKNTGKNFHDINMSNEIYIPKREE